MTIKLEVGRRYVARDGSLWGPLRFANGPGTYPFQHGNSLMATWTKDGFFYAHTNEEHPRDLIALAPDEAPQQVTQGVSDALNDALMQSVEPQPDELATLRERVQKHDGDMGTMRETVRVWRETAKAAEADRDTLRAENARLRKALDKVGFYAAGNDGPCETIAAFVLKTLAQTEAENG